jgi:hypothetical protein
LIFYSNFFASPSFQLTVLTTGPVEEREIFDSFFEFRLTLDTKSDANDRFTATIRNNISAFLAMSRTFTTGQATSRRLHCRFYGGIYLLLHVSISGPANSHNLLPFACKR